MKKSLTFRQDGTFKIVQFTDLHWKTGAEEDCRTHDLMSCIIKEELPDLVVVTGDAIQSKESPDPIQAFLQAISPMEQHGIPWTYVFGNHDAEQGVTQRELIQLLQASERCLFESGPEEISGLGNHVLNIYNNDRSQKKAVMYFFDSHAYAAEGLGKYDWIKRDQIEWYTRRSAAIKSKYGRVLPALSFFHIPLPEYAELYMNSTTYGVKGEDVCAPVLNSGLFTAFVEMGDVIGTFAGHDHANDYWGEWYGIKLCYGRVSGYNTYPSNGQARGARIIKLKEEEHDFETWIRQDDGLVVEKD